MRDVLRNLQYIFLLVLLVTLPVSLLAVGLAMTPPVFAQEPVGKLQEPFTAPTLERGDPWSPPAAPFTTAALDEAGPCDYLPEWIDNSGGEVLPPGFPTSGDVQEILDWTGLEVSHTLGCERARDGETYLSLETLELKCGPAAVIARADRDGVPLEGVLLFMNWPNMGDANIFPPGGVDPSYFSEGVGGFTDGGGAVGWGYGGGSFITPGIGGPFSVWGSACTDANCRYGVWVGSDILLRTGWFGGTNHCTINPWFEPRVKEGGGVGPADSAWLGVFEEGELLYHVPLVRGMPGGSFDDFRGLGYIAPDGMWLWHAPGVEGQPQ